jgi:uncharacterized iron-regulated protein
MLENHRFQALVTSAVAAIKSRILAFFARYDGEIDQLKQQVTAGAAGVDRELAQRYPERYPAIKQQAAEAKSWYDQQIAEQQANPNRPLPVAQTNLHLAEQMEELGQKVAQTEREVKAKIVAKLGAEAPKS